jgi:hypothetical protein
MLVIFLIGTARPKPSGINELRESLRVTAKQWNAGMTAGLRPGD